MELCLGMTPELLAALVANQTAGFFAGLKRRSFLASVCGGLDLLEGFVLVLFQPFESSLDCGKCQLRCTLVVVVIRRTTSGSL